MPLTQPASTRPNPNSYWITPSLLAGEYPHFIDELTQQSPLPVYLAQGFSYFIDLRQYETSPEYYHLALPSHSPLTGLPIIYQNMPIKNFDVPHSKQAMQLILETINEAIDAGHKVYVHCWAGIGRTGTVMGCYLTERGYTGEEAVSVLQQFWRQCAKSSYTQSPETSAQVQWIKEWSMPTSE